MVRPLILALAGSLLIAPARAELDLTPKLSEYELDGVKFKQLAFSDGSKIVTYAPPRGWDYSGSATQLTLRPPGKSQAEATIKKVALSQPASFDEGTAKKLVQEAIASVPPGSTDIQLVSQEKNPLMIERKETFLVTLSYNLLWRRLQPFDSVSKPRQGTDPVSVKLSPSRFQRTTGCVF